MKFLCADVTDRLPFQDGSFDLILCKATFDAVLCSIGSKFQAKRLVEESVRLLSNDGHGIFFLVSTGNPDNRVEYFEDDGDLGHYWNTVRTYTVPNKPLVPPSTTTTAATGWGGPSSASSRHQSGGKRGGKKGTRAGGGGGGGSGDNESNNK